jgi:hypothetical protein
MDSDNTLAVAISSDPRSHGGMIAQQRSADTLPEHQSQPAQLPEHDGSWRSYYEDPECEER